jgi:histidine triad (HIT) family protein
MKDCIFCKIIEKKIPADIVFEDERVIVFKDIKPKAPIHLLIVPKKHIISVNEIEEKDKEIMGELLLVAKKMGRENKIKDFGYKLTINVGEGAGQEVPHLHIHLLGGWKN